MGFARNMETILAKRLWIPEPGTVVKLKAFWMYTRLNSAGGFPAPGPWSHLLVVAVNVAPTPETSSVRLRYVPLPGDKPEAGKAWEGAAALSDISLPLGWHSTYDIYAGNKTCADLIISDWFGRGIAVWASHDLSSAGRMAFTPLTDGKPNGSPHWQYTGNPVEVVAPELCPRVFNVWQQHEGSLNMMPGYKGHGTEAQVKAEEKAAVVWLRSKGWTCRRAGPLWEVWKDELKHKAEYDNG